MDVRDRKLTVSKRVLGCGGIDLTFKALTMKQKADLCWESN